ncbi:MAG: hypothetical protein RLY58_1280 [Pseudomonadota bacterium]|jgi:chromosomal replication initiation ATPase DnaA
MLNDQKPSVNAVPTGGIAQIASVAQCYQAIKRTEDRHALLPGLAVFYGPSGFGKSVAACYVANKTRAYYVQAKSTYTKKAFLHAVLREMSIPPASTLSEMLDQAAGELAKSRRPLIVDEFDFLVSAGKVELVRDLYEGSQGTILCIGEERLPSKLEKWERFHGRVLNWVPCPAANVNDAALLLPVYAPSLDVSTDVLEQLVATVRGSTRRIATNLEMLHELALGEGIKRIDARSVRDLLPAGFVTGESPKPRSF